MTDEELAAIEARAQVRAEVDPDDDLAALAAEVRRLRSLHCVREIIGEEPLMCYQHGWVPSR